MNLLVFLRKNDIKFERNISLSKFTGIIHEGKISLIAKPDSISKLIVLCKYVLEEKLTFEIVGNLTNTYLCSGIKRDIFIQTTLVKDYRINQDNTLTVGCGYNLTKLSKALSLEGIGGYAGFVGIPGTVGGAAINNSGAFDSCMSNVVRYVTIISSNGEIQEIYNDELHYSTRNSILKNNKFGMLISVTLNTSPVVNPSLTLQKIKIYSLIRKTSIDGNRKSLGSIIVGHTLSYIWQEHRLANFFRRILYFPFKYTRWRKRAQCFSEFFVLGGMRFIKHCDNLGRFCWDEDTKEEDFLDYIDFIVNKSNNKIQIEIEIKK